MTDNKIGYTFKEYPPCRIYSCANCPYREGVFCRYEKDGDSDD